MEEWQTAEDVATLDARKVRTEMLMCIGLMKVAFFVACIIVKVDDSVGLIELVSALLEGGLVLTAVASQRPCAIGYCLVAIVMFDTVLFGVMCALLTRDSPIFSLVATASTCVPLVMLSVFCYMEHSSAQHRQRQHQNQVRLHATLA